jgi:glycosyltransferase involved in cell wall biosynthesis
MRRGSLLYVVPVMPQTFGNGLAMRAATVLEALGCRFNVHLYVVPVTGGLAPPSDFARHNTVRIGGLDLAKNLDPLYGLIARVSDPDERERAELAYPKPYLSRFCTSESASSILEWSSVCPVNALHVMRLYLAPLALPFLRRPPADRPFCVLDLDDDDARTYRRLMRIHNDSGNSRAAAAAGAEAEKYRVFAQTYLAGFDRVTVSSEADANRLAGRFPGVRFAVVPNGFQPIVRILQHQPAELGPLRLLFVGTFGYFPNVDAALFLCREVLPALRRLTDREIRIDLVGSDSKTAMASLLRHFEVRLHDFVQDLAPLYTAADVVVVPLRAGGGTRIKILESFAHGVPVVTTRLGAEGIDAANGVHLLFADNAADFARACLQIKEAPEFAARLAAHAADLLAARYTPARIEAELSKAYMDP